MGEVGDPFEDNDDIVLCDPSNHARCCRGRARPGLAKLVDDDERTWVLAWVRLPETRDTEPVSNTIPVTPVPAPKARRKPWVVEVGTEYGFSFESPPNVNTAALYAVALVGLEELKGGDEVLVLPPIGDHLYRGVIRPDGFGRMTININGEVILLGTVKGHRETLHKKALLSEVA